MNLPRAAIAILLALTAVGCSRPVVDMGGGEETGSDGDSDSDTDTDTDVDTDTDSDGDTDTDVDTETDTWDEYHGVGAPCEDGLDCADVADDDVTCMEDLQPMVDLVFPGGYCTATCTDTDTECGQDDAECVIVMVPTGNGLCVLTCDSESDCREDEGYQCLTMEEAWPTITPTTESQLCTVPYE